MPSKNGHVTSPTLDIIDRGKLCAGCGACVALAPGALEMSLSPDGFLRPVQKEPLTNKQEEAVAAVCPGLGYNQALHPSTHHKLWGPTTGVYQGYANDAYLRHQASSGGGLSALLVHLVETGAIDSVLQTTEDSKLPIGNRTALNADAVAISKAAGSRYAPSAPLEKIQECIESGGRYAFVGKPCDVAALRSMENIDPRITECFPYMLSFFCAGVPSLSGARGILSALEVEEENVASFRYRGNGWPGFATATCRDGSQKQMSYANSWGGILSKHIQLRCKLCPDGTGGLADIVCADAWETDDKGYPLFEERDGISLIISRTEKGEALIREAAYKKRITLSEFDISALERIQPGQTQKRRYAFSRILALRILRRPWPRFAGFNLAYNAASAGVWPNLKNMLGIFRRALGGKL